jgi:2,3-bisphosphoglycerate-independent phosphoglycerate mutase
VGIRESDPFEAIANAYESNSELTDYYVKPILLVSEEDLPVAVVEDGDSFIFWNFRSDRARQLTYALTQGSFETFTREKFPDIYFVCMSVYDQNLELPVAFPQKKVDNNLGNILSKHGLEQLRIAETEKYAHVTFFFNSQVEEPNLGEHRILVPSPKIPSYKDKPEMSAYKITKKVIHELEKEFYDFILVNFANGDLVGHSANLDAGIKACEVVDECVGRVITTGLEKNYSIIVTGDHGNIETMFFPDGSPNPSHGTNPVPFILISNKEDLKNCRLKKCKGLSSVSPTILAIMDINIPPEMTSESLLF